MRYQPPRYMLIPQLIRQLLAAAQEHQVDYLDADRTLAIALCRMGAEPEGAKRGEFMVAGTLGELLSYTEPTPEQVAEDQREDDAYEEANPTVSEKEMDIRREARAVRRAIAFWGEPLHTLILVGRRLHPLEVAYGHTLTQPGSRWNEVAASVYGCGA